MSNTSYFYAAGLGLGKALYQVRDLASATPHFEKRAYAMPRMADDGFFVQDIAAVDQRDCENDCLRKTPFESPFFLLALSKNAATILVVAIDASQTPTSYLYVRGVEVTQQSGKKRRDGDPSIGGVGACFTFSTSLTEDLRVACSSNKGQGLFEVVLPLDLGPCRDSWAPFLEETGDNTTVVAPPTSVGVCDLRTSPTLPVSVRYLVD